MCRGDRWAAEVLALSVRDLRPGYRTENATLPGSLDSAALSDVIWLNLGGDRWYVALGSSAHQLSPE